MEPQAYVSKTDHPNFAVIGAIILERPKRVPFDVTGIDQRHAMLGDIDRVLGWVEFGFHEN
jgi:hypothetical protein